MAWWSRHTHTHRKTQEKKKTTIREETHDRHELDHHTFTRWLHSHAGTHTPVDSISNNTTVMAPPLDRRGLGFRLYTPVATDSVPGGGAEPGRRGESSAKSREREKDKGSERLAGERELGGLHVLLCIRLEGTYIYIYIWPRVYCWTQGSALLRVYHGGRRRLGREWGTHPVCVCCWANAHTHWGRLDEDGSSGVRRQREMRRGGSPLSLSYYIIYPTR